MNIQIIAVGDIKEKYLKDAVNEYVKRLSRFGSVNIIDVSEYRLGQGSNILLEGREIIKHIKKSDFTVALCVEGKTLDSMEFAGCIEKAGINGKSTVTFIIGGSDGLSDEVKNAADIKLSFSKMTFPHMLMKVILLEQIYRAFKIINGETYHK